VQHNKMGSRLTAMGSFATFAFFWEVRFSPDSDIAISESRCGSPKSARHLGDAGLILLNFKIRKARDVGRPKAIFNEAATPAAAPVPNFGPEQKMHIHHTILVRSARSRLA